MHEPIQDWYRLLDAEPGATLAELRQSYRDLVKIYHPDRFSHDSRLQQKCQNKLKAINEAFERLKQQHEEGTAPQPAPSATPQPEYHATYGRCAMCRTPISADREYCPECIEDMVFASAPPPKRGSSLGASILAVLMVPVSVFLTMLALPSLPETMQKPSTLLGAFLLSAGAAWMVVKR